MFIVIVAVFFAIFSFAAAEFNTAYQIQENNKAVATLSATSQYRAELPVCKALQKLDSIPPSVEFYRGTAGYGWHAAQVLRGIYRSTNCAVILHIKG